MSRRVVVAGVTIAAMLAASRMGAAQGRTALRARADSLLNLWRDTVAIADMEDSLHAIRGGGAGRVTVRAGGGALVILANPSPLPLRAAAERAWAVLDSVLGPEAAIALAGRRLVVDVIDEADTTRRRVPVDADLHVPASLSVEALTRTILLAGSLDPGDADLHAWLGGRILHATAPERQRAAIYVELVTTAAAAARRCFAGTPGGCRDALDLSGDTEPWRRWYNPADRARVIGESFAYYFGRGRTQVQFTACTAGADDSACVELFRAIPAGAMPKPVSVDVRRAVLLRALEIGGRDAFGRLARARGRSMEERLAIAAGIPADSLLALWRAEILAARPRPVTVPLWAVGLATFWVGVFSACSLGSSRWRLG
jgi:hypothetical protein